MLSVSELGKEEVFPHVMQRVDMQNGKRLLSRHCQKVPNQNRANIFFKIAPYSLLQRIIEFLPRHHDVYCSTLMYEDFFQQSILAG